MTIKETNEPALIYLGKNGLQYYAKNLPAAIGFNFPATLVKDLEIRNLEELNNLIKSFIAQAKLSPTELLTIIGDDLCIQKDFPVTDKKDTDDLTVEQFVSAIPFDYIRTKTYKLGRSTKVIAVNRDFYEAVQTAFAKNGFTIGNTLLKSFPGSLIAADNFGPALNKKLQDKQEWIKQNDFAGLSHAQTVAIDQQEKTRNNKNTWILIGIMALLVAILVVMIIIFKPFTPEKPRHTIPSASEVVPSPIVVPPPPTTIQPETPQASASAETVRIEIFNASGVPGQADIVRRELLAAGFTDISTGNTTAGSRTTVNYLATVSPTSLDKVIRQLKLSYPSLLAQSSPNLPFDIVITLGKDRVTNQTTP